MNRLRPWLSASEFQPESASLPERGFDTALAAHSFHRSGNNSEAYAGAFVLAGPIAALEDSEDLALRFARDADAVVLKPKPDPRSVRICVAFGARFRNSVTRPAEFAGITFTASGSWLDLFAPDFHDRIDPRLAELQGILKQIGNALADQRAVREN